MYIKKIEFTNFRRFQELSIELPKNLAVFIGWNGSGKTTILDGIYKFFLRYIYEVETIYEIDHLSSYESSLNRYDLYYKSEESKINITIYRDWILNDHPFYIWEMGYKKDKSNDEDLILTRNKKEIEEFIKNKQQNWISIMVYYQFSSLKPKKLYEEEFSSIETYFYNEQMFAYKNPLVEKLDGYQNFIEWFKEEEDKENEEIRSRKDFEYSNKNLEIIRNSLIIFLKRLSMTNFSDLRVVRTKPEYFSFTSVPMTPELTISKDNMDLKISQLSDGEKKCILIVADIARRLAIANPGLEVSDVLKKGKGVILIDEIEAHLHPGWQREIIPALTQTFPSCQFIVTTHSPQVLSKVKKENVFVLEDGKVYEASHTYGRDSNSILSETMGVPKRPIEIQEKLDECFDLIDDHQLEEAKAKLKELSDLLGQNDAEIVKINTTLDFVERIE